MTVRATAPMLPTPLLAVGTDPQHLEVALADAGVGIGGLGQERCAALAWLIKMNVA